MSAPWKGIEEEAAATFLEPSDAAPHPALTALLRRAVARGVILAGAAIAEGEDAAERCSRLADAVIAGDVKP